MKKRFSRADVLALGGIMLLTLLIIASCLSPDTVYGSKDDWASQHYAIPEYFRTLFYSTHSLSPSYAPNIGGGENIYSLSYYGLHSPVILFSYLLPFVPMGSYIIAASIISALFSEGALYCLFRRRYGTAVTACVTLFFALSVPLIINTHRQVVFTGYMPFLLLAMHCADGYFRHGRRSALIISAFLMIMCNYYFAVSALTSLLCCGAYILLSDTDAKPRELLRRFLPYAAALGVSVLMSAGLLLPTAYVLIHGRSGANCAPLSDFLPSVRFDKLTYFGSTMGLSAFGVFSAIYALFRGKRATRFIASGVLLSAVFPGITYLLNGTLYFDPKVLFAFLPLALIPAAELLKRCFSELPARFGGLFSWEALAVFGAATAVSAVCCKFSVFIIAFIVDAALFVIGALLIAKTSKKGFCCLFFAFPFAATVIGAHYDALQTKESYRLVNSATVAGLVSEVSQDDMVRTAIDTTRLYTVNKVYSERHYQDTIYSSVHSQDYNRFYLSEMYNENEYRNSALTTRSRNILFNCYMGNRYYITHEPVSFCGLELIKQAPDGFCLYENPNALPLIRTGAEQMSLRQYKSIEYPHNIEALLKYTVVPDELPDVEFSPSAVQVDAGDIFDLAECSAVSGNYETELADGVRTIRPEGGILSYTYTLPESVRGKILLLRFHVGDEKPLSSFSWERGGDVRIKINGVKNTLTNPEWKYRNGNNLFEYVISDMSDELDIELTGRELMLSQLTVYALEPEFLDGLTDGLSPFRADMERTGGDLICGSLSAEKDGIAASGLVYQDGFTVLVDGEEVDPVKVDTAFLGFPVTAGDHEIEIRFTAPLLGIGQLASSSGLLLLLAVFFTDRLKKK